MESIELVGLTGSREDTKADVQLFRKGSFSIHPQPLNTKSAGRGDLLAPQKFQVPAGSNDLGNALLKSFRRIAKSLKQNAFKALKRPARKNMQDEAIEEIEVAEGAALINYQASTCLSRVNQENYNVELISRSISRRLVYRKCNFNSALFVLMAVSSVLLQFGLGYFKFYLSDLVFKELKNKLLAADLNSWTLWATSNLLVLLDTSRMVYEGLVPDDIYAPYSNSTLLRANSKLKRSMYLSNFANNWNYNLLMRNASLGLFLDKRIFTSPGPIRVWNPGNVDWDKPPSTVEWRSESRGFLEAWSYVSPLLNAYSRRNDTTYKSLPIGQARDGDLLAEFVRRNAGGDLLEHQTTAGRLIHKYFRDICKFNMYIETYGNIFNLCLLTLATLVFAVLLLLMIRKKKGYYETLFKIKVRPADADLRA